MSRRETILLEREGKIGVATLNRPDKRNALSIRVREELADALDELAEDAAVAVVVILGAGPLFCAGFDKSEFANRDPNHVQAMRESSERHHLTLAEFPKPLVAGIHGAALGGGFDVAVLCDLRLAAADATFAHPEIKFGAPALFGPLREIVGGGLARELVLTGRTIGADEALRTGLVSRVVPAAELREACLTTARTIAEAPPAAIRSMKRQIVASHGGWEGLKQGEPGGGVFEFF